MKKQVIIIRGGETFETYEDYLFFLKSYEPDMARFTRKSWRETLGERLGEDYEVISLLMPNTFNAKYAEWKIYFERIASKLADEVILVGNSLGGIFLAKYLSENTFSKKIKGLFLVAAPYDAEGENYTLADFTLGPDLGPVTAQAESLYLYFCEDDPVVSFGNMEKYAKALPGAHERTFKGIGHFAVPNLPEIADDIRSLN